MSNVLHSCLKGMENSAQRLIFDIPQPGSKAYQALDLHCGDEWKIGALIHFVAWYRDRVTSAATLEFLKSPHD